MIDVVAAIITNSEGNFLITQRNFNKSQGGLWEFPGGKIEQNESKENAIIREIKEELNLDISVDKYIGEKIHNYPGKDINLIALKCSILGGNIQLLEHEDYRWSNIEDLKKYSFAPADGFIVDILVRKEY